jgi:hypothetical protein
MTTNQNHASQTVESIRRAKDILTLARIDAYATGDEVGNEVDLAIEKLDDTLRRIGVGTVGTSTAVPTSNRCALHPAFEADYCPACGTATRLA